MLFISLWVFLLSVICFYWAKQNNFMNLHFISYFNNTTNLYTYLVYLTRKVIWRMGIITLNILKNIFVTFSFITGNLWGLCLSIKCNYFFFYSQQSKSKIRILIHKVISSYQPNFLSDSFKLNQSENHMYTKRHYQKIDIS